MWHGSRKKNEHEKKISKQAFVVGYGFGNTGRVLISPKGVSYRVYTVKKWAMKMS